jgi:uncharacterized protein with GYD domain
MPTYIMLSTLTAEGGQTLHAHPERLGQVNAEVERMGCHVIAQYATLGQYDFVTVVEAPDNESVAHLSVDLGSRGTMKVMTLPALSGEAFMARLMGPEQIGKD